MVKRDLGITKAFSPPPPPTRALRKDVKERDVGKSSLKDGP